MYNIIFFYLVYSDRRVITAINTCVCLIPSEVINVDTTQRDQKKKNNNALCVLPKNYTKENICLGKI